jgi:hypothetical protein
LATLDSSGTIWLTLVTIGKTSVNIGKHQSPSVNIGNIGNIGLIGLKSATLFPSGTDIVAVDDLMT